MRHAKSACTSIIANSSDPNALQIAEILRRLLGAILWARTSLCGNDPRQNLPLRRFGAF